MTQKGNLCATLLAIITLALVNSAIARPFEAFSMNGQCQELVSLGQNWTNVCIGKLASVSAANGNVGFTFVASKKGLASAITFDGRGPDQVKLDANQILQPVRRVIVALPGFPRQSIPAVGSCRYTNPFMGKAVIECVATASIGRYAGRFVTDGHEPASQKF